jgi:pimeloyl-ACP methyl ester carboxylesterase
MKKHRHKILTLAILTGLATGVIHIMNKMIAATAVLKDMLHVSDRNYYKWRFGRIYYTKQGSGSPVLLIHDLTPGSSGYEWNRIEKYLSMEHTVYTIDLLGCGRSDKPKITYTNFIYVQIICDFIKNVIKERTDVIASGFSSSFVFMACHNEKELFNKLMMVNPPSLGSLNVIPDSKSKLLKFAIEIPIFGTLVYHMFTSQENIRSLFMEKYFNNPFHVTNELVDAYYEGSHRDSCDAKFLYASIASHYVNINIAHGVKSIDNSIFFLTGEKENGPENAIQDYLQLNPAIETSVIPRTKHLPHLEDPEAFLEQVGIFFS